MSKLTVCLLSVFIVVNAFAQKERTINLYLTGQYNQTLYDRTLGNNPWGFGLGLQSFVTTHSKFKATLELTGDAYLYDDKLYRIDDSGNGIEDLGSMVNLFAGASWHPTNKLYMSLTGGPSFINDKTFFGIKPAIGLFSENKGFMMKLAFINVFNRYAKTEDFGTISISMGVRLF